jgi:MoxR-like ATPase
VAREDLQAAALAVLRHRLALNDEAVAENIAPDMILGQVLDTVSPR